MKRTNGIIGIVSGVGILCLSVCIFIEIVARYVLNSPTTWSFDISMYTFLLVSFMAFPFTMQEDAHIGFNMLIERVEHNRIWRKAFALIRGVFGMSFCGFLSYETLKLTILAIRANWMTRGVTQIPICYLYAIMTIGSFLLLATFLIKTIFLLFDLEE